MIDRPINFSTAMVRALLAGRKTSTRRLVSSPYRECRPGDRLWVRESFAPATGPAGNWSRIPMAAYILFRDGALRFRDAPTYAVDLNGFYWRATWCAATLMPRWASRSTLIVENVRTGPLHDVNRWDAIAEGPLPFPTHRGPLWLWPGEPGLPCVSPVAALRASWRKTHGTAGERWEDNPDVVVLTFRLRRTNIDC